MVRGLFAFILLSLALPARASTAEKYYVVLFGYQDQVNRVANSHTFATFVKETSADGAAPVLEQKTISWLPADFAETLTLPSGLVAGKNFSLDETLSAVARANARFRDGGDPTRIEVKSYGAYPLTRESFEKAEARIAQLESGKISYKVIDLWSRNGKTKPAVNCIHALSDILPGLNTGGSRGFEATEKVLELFKTQHFFSSPEEDRSRADALMKATREATATKSIGSAVSTPNTH